MINPNPLNIQNHNYMKTTKLYPHLKILYTSGYPEKVKGNWHILSPLIIKPYKLMDLAVTIKNLLGASDSDK